MKIEIKYYDELTKEQQGKIMNDFVEYRDNAGNTVDTILEAFDGELQEFDGAQQG